jgi:alpha-L-rhamnosidase
MRSVLPAMIGLCMVSLASAADSPAKVEYPRCEYRVDPLGIDVTEPRLSWEMRDARRGAKQTAYQILVASTPEKLAADQGDLWDSGRVASDQSTQIVYAGKPLQSRMRCHWKVRLWDANGNATPYSTSALWTMGLLKPEDVKAKWIGLDQKMMYPDSTKIPPPTFDGCAWFWAAEPGVNAQQSAPAGERFFRRCVTIPEGKAIRQGQFLIAADDAAELFVNGKSVGACANANVPLVIDLSAHLNAGKNCIAVIGRNATVSPAALVGKLVIYFEAGEPIVQPIDASWKAAVKPEADWNLPTFDDSKWPAAVQVAKIGDAPWGKIKAPEWTLPYACPLLRKEFKVAGAVRRATVYGSALGIYRLHINGRPVGDDYFTPDWTDYKKRVYYNTYDVTDLVRSDGPNAIGGVLSAGWYSGAIGWGQMRHHYGDKPRLFVQLEIELADGTIQTIATDDTWKIAFGPYVEGEFLAGETYDATKEIPGWSMPGLSDAAWQPVAVTKSISPAVLEAFPSVTVQETGVLKPVKITEPKPGAYVFDLGQNFAGFARLKAHGSAGTKIVLRFAEVLNPDGTIYTVNLRGARAIDTYVLKGEGEEVWQPRFTFHGFRYVEVTGYPGKPDEDAITGVAVNSKVPLTGTFECSSSMVNKLYQNIVWTQRANYISVPTDCPQRDERLGWTGDAETFVRAATYNADVAAFFTKWLVDLEDAQGPEGDFPDVAPRVVDANGGAAAWADAGTICPLTIYQVYNDRRLLAKHYAAMGRWVEYCRKNSTDLLRPAAGFGDWLSIKADTPLDVIATAYFAYSTHLTAEAARALGKQDDARKYDELFQQIKAAFNKAYVAPDGRIKGNTQTCYVMALWFDLLPKEKRDAAVRYLVDDIKSRDTHLSTGFVGTSVLMPTLSANGNTPLAYKLLLNDTFPSWGFSIKHGATSIWERWDGWTLEKGFQDPGMNSFAHYSFGAVARWMFQTAAGIDMAEPGFQRLLIRPQPAPGLTWVKAGYNSPHGPIASEWSTADGKFSLAVTIPANATATVHLPAADPAAIKEGGKPATEAEGVKLLRSDGGESVFEVGAGQYRFSMPYASKVE